VRVVLFASAFVVTLFGTAQAGDVSTLAGSGRLGTNDGAALTAGFVMPAGVAVGPDGAVYVADAGAQTIRRIRGGRVETIAGRVAPGVASDELASGYEDGPANLARFSRPVAVAIGAGGVVYVADAGNNCIRKIEDGVVSTLAGSPAPGASNGIGAKASFRNLRALAIDDVGNLYAADYGVGIRRISPSGAVVTLDLPSAKKTVVSVAARSFGKRFMLAYSDSEAIHTFLNGKLQAIGYDETREPGTSGLPVGFADSLAIVNENTLVVTDVASEAVRLVRLPAPPFITDTMTRGLAGGVREGGDGDGGFADGPSASASVDTPLDVAVAPDGSFIVADAGNRRIRRIARVDTRESVLPNFDNFELDPQNYNVAFVGNSYAFFNVLWPESIPGTIEAGLARDGKRLGLGRTARVAAFRIDAVSPAAETSMISNVLADGQVRLIVLLANYFGPPDPKLVRLLEHDLARTHTKLLLVFIPQGYEVSPLEYWKSNVARSGYDFASLRAQAVKQETYYHVLGIHALLLLDAMQQQEAGPNRRDLYYGGDHHLTVYGSQWVGNRILEEIERWEPWK
jgi:hypothetical protein